MVCIVAAAAVIVAVKVRTDQYCTQLGRHPTSHEIHSSARSLASRTEFGPQPNPREGSCWNAWHVCTVAAAHSSSSASKPGGVATRQAAPAAALAPSPALSSSHPPCRGRRRLLRRTGSIPIGGGRLLSSFSAGCMYLTTRSGRQQAASPQHCSGSIVNEGQVRGACACAWVLLYGLRRLQLLLKGRSTCRSLVELEKLGQTSVQSLTFVVCLVWWGQTLAQTNTAEMV